ncbi:MAG: nucleotide exchange factor GrpE [Clostridia bacterium]|nr:nucleotide exchange factor GrpE [Clostridia bacterium]
METEEKINQTAEVEEEVIENAEESAAEEVAEPSETEKLQAEIDTLKDKMMRHAAEFDNFKKRTAKEREELYVLAVCDTVEKVLPVKDNLERAVGAAEGSENGMLEGVTMILKQLDDIFAALGVEKIKTVGEEFNPELHNAVMHEESSEYGENTVSEELMSGFTCRGKVVRHAMVKVAN